MPWTNEGGPYPFLDPETNTIVIEHPTDDIRVEVMPMIYNDRIVVTLREDYPFSTIAGFCYDKGPGPELFAMHWVEHWDELDVPLGFKKIAYNEMPTRIGKGTP